MRRLLSGRIGRFLAAAVAFTAVAGVSGVSFAYWHSTGQGSGAASIGSMQTVTIEALVTADSPTERLYPGGPARDVTIKVKNPNAFTVDVFSIATNGGTVTADSGHSSCSNTGVSFSFTNMSLITQGTNPTPNKTLSGNSTVTLLHLPGAATLSMTSDSGCQGATFSIPVTLTVHR
jgi:hypothetical protein